MLLPEDRKLLTAFRAGDREALERVYSAYVESVTRLLRFGFSFNSGGRRCCFQGCRNEFDLEDRVHTVFLKAFSDRARLSYDGLSSYKGYLLTIARNIVIDDFRRKENTLMEYVIEEVRDQRPSRMEYSATDPIGGDVALSGQPALDAEVSDVTRLVQLFRERLSTREQQIFTLRYERELDHQEIIDRLGLSPSQIKTSERRIREAFFAFMRKHGFFTGYESKRGGWLRPLPKIGT